MKNILIRKNIEIQTVEVFNKDNISLGFANFDEFKDLTIQIKNQKAEGFYAVFEGEKFYITQFGTVLKPIKGFFELLEL